MSLSDKTQKALHQMVEHALDREIDFHQFVEPSQSHPVAAATELLLKSAPGRGQLALAWVQAMALLGKNDQECTAMEAEVVVNTLALRAGQMSPQAFAEWLLANTQPTTQDKPVKVARPRPVVEKVVEPAPAPAPQPFASTSVAAIRSNAESHERADEPQEPTEPATNGPARKGVMTLTYDGGQLCHLEHALPYLNALGLKATFFVDGADFVTHVNRWKEARAWGHEIANGCIVKAAYADGRMPAWNSQMIQDEIVETQGMFREVLGIEPTSFAFPWGYPQCQGGADYRHVAQARFIYARSGLEGYNDPSILSLKYLRCVRCDGYDGNDLIRLAENGLARGSWVIMAFDGIGSGERAIDHSTHQTFLRWVHQNRFEFSIDTLQNVGQMLAEQQTLA